MCSAKSNQFVGDDAGWKSIHAAVRVQQNLTIITDFVPRTRNIGYLDFAASASTVLIGANWLELWADDTWGRFALPRNA